MRRRALINNKPTPYLDVEPAEVQWITMTNPVIYDVRSNVGWIIQ